MKKSMGIALFAMLLQPAFANPLLEIQQAERLEKEKVESEINSLHLEKEKEKQAQEMAALKAQKELEMAKLKAKEIKAQNQKALTNERLADKHRDQQYEDELRALELEERKMMLAEKKAMAEARAKRAADFANNQVNAEKAVISETTATADLIQSKADATRIKAESNAELQKKQGEAIVIDAKGDATFKSKIGDAAIKESDKLF
ncbi:DUF5384 family protein [Shewanella algae]